MKRFDKKVFIVAEISANHGQNFKRAVSLIKMAKKCGADAVKFQAYTPDSLTINANNRFFKIKHDKWGGQTLYKLYEKAYMPPKWFKKLKHVSDDEGVLFFASAFDKKSVDLLESLRVKIHKIPSFELVDLPLIEYIAKTKKRLFMSTGMACMAEVKEAVQTAKKSGAGEIVLLKCVSSYPADPKDMNLKTIPHMAENFKCPVGLSDHTLGVVASISAVSLGARVIEKHFTLSRSIKTPDSFFSIEPDELKSLVRGVRIAEEALGRVHYGLTKKEKEMRIFRRSIFASEDIKKGEILTEKNVRSVRPAYGIHPRHLKKILGKKAKQDIKKATPFKLNFVQK